MTVKRRVVQALDGPVTRSLLARLATARARRVLARDDVEISYAGGWQHRIGAHVFPDGPRFEYHDAAIRAWAGEVAKHRRNADDYWFRGYTPAAGDVIVDVGAGRGEDVLAFSERVGQTGRVLAIEAHPASFRLLEAFCRMNGLRNVTPINCALMDAPGSVTIEDASDWRANTVSGAATPAAGTMVPATTLDALCREQGIGEIAFLKMNIEGAERMALRGMPAALARTRHVCVCCHDFRAERGDGDQYRTRDEVVATLTASGFLVTGRRDDPRAYVRDHVHGARGTAAIA